MGWRMRSLRSRRRFIIATAGLLVTAPSRAQAPRRRVAVLAYNLPGRDWFITEFAKHGFVEGRNLEIVMVPMKVEDGFVPGVRRAVELSANVVIAHVGVHDTRTKLLPISGAVPLVVVGQDDSGDDSLETLKAHGENFTAAIYSYRELVRLRLELMKQLKPAAKRFSILFPGKSPVLPPAQEEARQRERERASRALGMQFVPVELERYGDADELIRKLREARIDVVEYAWGDDPGVWDQLARNGIPASAVGRRRAEKGALLAGWTVGFNEIAVRLAARILNGAPAASLPIERALEFGLAINLRTARTLGIVVPPQLLLRADVVFGQ